MFGEAPDSNNREMSSNFLSGAVSRRSWRSFCSKLGLCQVCSAVSPSWFCRFRSAPDSIKREAMVLQNVKEYCHNYLLNLQLSLLFAVDFELRHCCSFVLLYVETLCFICTRAFVSCHVDCIWLSWVAGTWHNKSNQEVISGKEGYNTCTRNFALTFM